MFSSPYFYILKNRTARRKCRGKRQERQFRINATLNTKQTYTGLVTYLLEKTFDVARDYMLANELLNYWVRTSVKLRQETQTEALRMRIIFSDKLKNH